MASNVDKYVTDTEHTSIDHTGLPGIGGGNDTLPIGSIATFVVAVSSIPLGWLPCDGFAYGRTSGDPNPQPDLFAVVGTDWGVGDGATTFNVPDFRGKSLLNVNDGSLPEGVDGGFTARALAATGGAETHQLITSEMPGHTHDVTTASTSSGSIVAATTNATPGTSATTSTGGDGFHNNMHPFSVVNYAIKSALVAGSAVVSLQSDTFVPTTGQTVFTLSANATAAPSTSAYVNFAKYIYGSNFTVSGDQFTWLDYPFTLDGDDVLEVVYFV